MSITFKLEEQFERIYDMLDAASKGEDIGPLTVRDALKDLEAEIEQALSNACYLCGEPLSGLCLSCQEWESEKERDCYV